MKIERVLNYILLVALIIILTFAIVNGQDKEVIPESIPDQEIETNLNVTIIDGINDKLINLENCKVAVIGKLRLVEDVFNYTKTFKEGDKYDITISIRKKI